MFFIFLSFALYGASSFEITELLLLESVSNTTVDGKTNKSKSTVCRLESMGDILQQIFRDDGNPHAQYYRVSYEIMLSFLGWQVEE